MKDIKYIYWAKESTINHCTNQEWADLVHLFWEEGYKELPYSTRRNDYNEYDDSFSYRKIGQYCYLYYSHYNYDEDKYEHTMYTTDYRDDKNNYDENLHIGTKAVKECNKAFERIYGVGETLLKAFGHTEWRFKYCVPRQFYLNWAEPNEFYHASSIDFCSQYPSNLCGTLPDAHTAIQYKGTVKPTKEYPFAFYLISGHCAEYNNFDTHNWLNSTLRQSLLGHKETCDGNPYLDPNEDVTVLMKASTYTLTQIMEEWYAARKINPIIKQMMVSLIGKFHTKKYRTNKFAHLAAIVIGRSNEKMRHVAEDIIGVENILHICVDGCIYKGGTAYGTTISKLNSIRQETQGCITRINAQNSYVMMKDKKVVKFKHGAFNARLDGLDIEICNGFDDMKQWYKKKTDLEEIIDGKEME